MHPFQRYRKRSNSRASKGRVPDLDYKTSLDLAHQLYSSLDTPRSLACSLLLKYNEIDQLINLSIDPEHYSSDWRRYLVDSQATNFMRKFKFRRKFHGRRARTRDVALAKLLECEVSCKEANDRIFSGNLSVDARAIMAKARLIVAGILGRFSCDEWVGSCQFGPGSDLSNKSDRATVYDKIVKRQFVTVDFYELGMELVKSSPSWAELHKDASPVWHNRITFVAKDAKTDRPIAIEPGLNAYAQAGLGRMIRKRLYRAGVDISDQQINQSLAEFGSIHGYLSTMDLSSASDTVCYALVMALLPPDWFHALDLTRSRFGKLPSGEVMCYEKFSSMGNGYTFELETLLFHALNLAVQWYYFRELKSFSSVYGDDIITPCYCFENLSRVLRELGFEVNSKKSFHRGLFRESCGEDFIDGCKVRSWYFKDPLNDLPSLYKAANSLSRLAYYLGASCFKDASLEGLHRSLCSLAAKHFGQEQQAVGPFSFTKGGSPAIVDKWLCVDWAFASRHRTVRRCSHQHEGWRVSCYRARSRKFRFENRSGDYPVALYVSRNGTPDMATNGNIPVRQLRPKYVRRRETILAWPSLGPWV